MLTTRDLPFPSSVTAPDGAALWSIARCRVVDGRLEVFAYTQGAVRLVGSGVVMGVEPVETQRNTLRVSTDDGDWIIAKGQGCGCSHPLKRTTDATLDAVAAKASA